MTENKNKIMALLSIPIALAFGISVAFASSNLQVESCSGGVSCSVSEYNSDDNGIGHTLKKGDTGKTTWSDITEQSITNSNLTIRHGGQNGISGSLNVFLKSADGSVTYCSDNTILNTVSPTTDVLDLGFCNLDWTEINDLSIEFVNGDIGNSQKAFVYFADLEVN